MGANERPENETGSEREEDRSGQSAFNTADAKQPVPLFLRGKSDGRHDNAQDEKDETPE